MSTEHAELVTHPKTPLHYYAIGAFATLLSGYDTGNIAGALLFIKRQLDLTAVTEGWVVSVLVIGGIIGALAGGKLADQIGRRNVILLMGLVFLAGSVGEALSPDVASLISFRFLVGLAVGCGSVTVPIYIAELAPTDTRGSLTSLFQLMIVIGTLCGYGTDAALGPSGGWRWMLGLGSIPALILLASIPFIPETPRWLVKQGRPKDARKVLEKLRNSTNVDQELRLIESLDSTTRAQRIGTRPSLIRAQRPALIIGIGLAFFSQITGINTIIYYAPTILTTLGLGDSVALITNVGLGAWAIVLAIVEIALVDVVGRKPLLLCGSLALAVSMGVLGLFQLIPWNHGVSIGVVAIICFLLFESGYQIGWGAIPTIITSEVFSRDVRGAATGICLSVNWGVNFVVSLTFPLLFAAGSGITFLIYCVMAVLACFFIVYWVPETKGLSLEQMERSMQRQD